jgi:hypothetical protein
MSSGEYWDEYSDESESGRERHRDPKHSRRTTAWAREENRAKSVSKHPSDNEEDFLQETPEAALVAAQAYLLTTQPEPGDPWEHMHQDAIRILGLVEDKLRKHPPEERRHIAKRSKKKISSADSRETKQASRRAMKKVRRERRMQGTL